MPTTEDVLKLISETLALREVTLDSQMGKVRGWDSLRHLKLMTAIEKKFGIKIPTHLLGKLVTAKQIVEHLKGAGVLAEV